MCSRKSSSELAEFNRINIRNELRSYFSPGGMSSFAHRLKPEKRWQDWSRSFAALGAQSPPVSFMPFRCEPSRMASTEKPSARAKNLGKPVEAKTEGRREITHPFVTPQTGEQPDDPFFDRGCIIVTTYDQVLSGLLCSPYGLSGRLHNVNAAAIAGAVVVFDEFHLMPPSKAFLTAVAALHLFRGLCHRSG